MNERDAVIAFGRRLADEGPDDGGLALVPASHKANLPAPADLGTAVAALAPTADTLSVSFKSGAKLSLPSTFRNCGSSSKRLRRSSRRSRWTR